MCFEKSCPPSPNILLMEEILHHPTCRKPCIKTEIFTISTGEFTGFLNHQTVWIGLSPLPVRVTTRIITFLVGNPYKPSFPLLLGGGTTQGMEIWCSSNFHSISEDFLFSSNLWRLESSCLPLYQLPHLVMMPRCHVVISTTRVMGILGIPPPKNKALLKDY